MAARSHCDVLIVGAGPTGLLCAAELARHGVIPRIIEKNARPSDQSKALAILPRTLEVLSDMGILDRFFAAGRRLKGIELHPGNGLPFYLDFEALDSRENCIVTLQQNKTEQILRDRVRELGIDIERPVEFVDYTETAGGIVSELRRADGTIEHCHSQWLVGADGAHSVTRERAGIPFEGHNLENTFIYVDAKVDWDLPADRTHPFFSDDGVVLVIPHPEDGYWRVVVDLPPGTKPPEGLPLEVFQDMVNRRTKTGATLSDPKCKTSFSIRQCKVPTFRKGRVLLAGDAGHCHSPVGGQGMNTGLHDAHNLAWKLALAVRGFGTADLIDSYSREREPVARELLSVTNKLTRAACLRGSVVPRLRDAFMNAVNDYGIGQRFGGNKLGGVSLHYNDSPICVDEHRRVPLLSRLAGGPRAGQRAPHVTAHRGSGPFQLTDLLTQPYHQVLVFDGASRGVGDRAAGFADELRRSYGELVKVHIVASQAASVADPPAGVLLDPYSEMRRRYLATGDSVCVIRPDGYIGYRSPRLDGARARHFLRKTFARTAPVVATRVAEAKSA